MKFRVTKRSSNTQCNNISEEIKKVTDQCKEEAGGSAVIDDKSSPSFDERKMKCFYACIGNRMGVMVNGKIDPMKEIELISSVVPEVNSPPRTKITECIDDANKISDECEAAVTAHLCIFDKGHFN